MTVVPLPTERVETRVSSPGGNGWRTVALNGMISDAARGRERRARAGLAAFRLVSSCLLSRAAPPATTHEEGVRPSSLSKVSSS